MFMTVRFLYHEWQNPRHLKTLDHYQAAKKPQNNEWTNPTFLAFDSHPSSTIIGWEKVQNPINVVWIMGYLMADNTQFWIMLEEEGNLRHILHGKTLRHSGHGAIHKLHNAFLAVFWPPTTYTLRCEINVPAGINMPPGEFSKYSKHAPRKT